MHKILLERELDRRLAYIDDFFFTLFLYCSDFLNFYRVHACITYAVFLNFQKTM